MREIISGNPDTRAVTGVSSEWLADHLDDSALNDCGLPAEQPFPYPGTYPWGYPPAGRIAANAYRKISGYFRLHGYLRKWHRCCSPLSVLSRIVRWLSIRAPER